MKSLEWKVIERSIILFSQGFGTVERPAGGRYSPDYLYAREQLRKRQIEALRYQFQWRRDSLDFDSLREKYARKTDDELLLIASESGAPSMTTP